MSESETFRNFQDQLQQKKDLLHKIKSGQTSLFE